MTRIKKTDSDLIPCVRQYKTLRRLRGMSVEDVSDITDISVSSIRSIESGRRNPNVRTLDLLCRAVGSSGLTVGGW